MFNVPVDQWKMRLTSKSYTLKKIGMNWGFSYLMWLGRLETTAKKHRDRSLNKDYCLTGLRCQQNNNKRSVSPKRLRTFMTWPLTFRLFQYPHTDTKRRKNKHVYVDKNELSLFLLFALDDRLGVLDEIVNEDGPGSLFVIVSQVVIHRRRKVQQQVPRVLHILI